MNVLFLDDMEDRHKIFKEKYQKQFNITHVFDYNACISELRAQKFEMVFLDHDLSLESIMCDPDDVSEKTGTDVALHIIETFDPKDAPGFVIHSLNPHGAERMRNLLSDAGFSVSKIPFFLL